jgi:hypothetical protein
VRGADARSRKRDRPEGVAHSFQVILNKVDPRPSRRAFSVFSSEVCKDALAALVSRVFAIAEATVKITSGPHVFAITFRANNTTLTFSGVYPRPGSIWSSDGAFQDRGVVRSNSIPVISHRPRSIRRWISRGSSVHGMPRVFARCLATFTSAKPRFSSRHCLWRDRTVAGAARFRARSFSRSHSLQEVRR